MGETRGSSTPSLPSSSGPWSSAESITISARRTGSGRKRYVNCTKCIVHCTKYIIHCTKYNIHCTKYIIHCTRTLYIVQSTLYIVQRLCSIYCGTWNKCSNFEKSSMTNKLCSPRFYISYTICDVNNPRKYQSNSSVYIKKLKHIF